MTKLAKNETLKAIINLSKIKDMINKVDQDNKQLANKIARTKELIEIFEKEEKERGKQW